MDPVIGILTSIYILLGCIIFYELIICFVCKIMICKVTSTQFQVLTNTFYFSKRSEYFFRPAKRWLVCVAIKQKLCGC